VTTVAIVDYGAGNLGNARRAVAALGLPVVMAGAPDDLPSDGPVLLPGVGAYGAAMERLAQRGLDAALRAAAAGGRRLVGICLGLQLLFETSEESGGAAGLGILGGRVRRLRSGALPLPHLGWCPVGPAGTPYYFAHSFCVEPAEPDIVLASAEWGERFPAVVRQGSVVGFQFHPERSGEAGLALLGRALRGEDVQP
jgi:imidazole glycerol phosphate synthase glutamine amidotransferase subunit